MRRDATLRKRRPRAAFRRSGGSWSGGTSRGTGRISSVMRMRYFSAFVCALGACPGLGLSSGTWGFEAFYRLLSRAEPNLKPRDLLPKPRLDILKSLFGLLAAFLRYANALDDVLGKLNRICPLGHRAREVAPTALWRRHQYQVCHWPLIVLSGHGPPPRVTRDRATQHCAKAAGHAAEMLMRFPSPGEAVLPPRGLLGNNRPMIDHSKSLRFIPAGRAHQGSSQNLGSRSAPFVTAFVTSGGQKDTHRLDRDPIDAPGRAHRRRALVATHCPPMLLRRRVRLQSSVEA